jgi:hypothetical protein
MKTLHELIIYKLTNEDIAMNKERTITSKFEQRQNNSFMKIMQWTSNEQMKNINNHKRTIHKWWWNMEQDAKGFNCGLKLNPKLIIIDSI